MTPYDTSRSLTRRVPIYDSSSVVEYHSPVNSTKLLISRISFMKAISVDDFFKLSIDYDWILILYLNAFFTQALVFHARDTLCNKFKERFHSSVEVQPLAR